MARMVTDSWVMAEVRDIKRAVAYYAKLGIRPTMRMPFYVELKLPGGTVLGLHSFGGKKGKSKGRADKKGWGIMLRVRNLQQVLAGLKRKRIRSSRMKAAPGGALVSTLYDPDGNRLVLLQMGKSS
jgi:predicted enzyme related to lactoylglutathione lyase